MDLAILVYFCLVAMLTILLICIFESGNKW
jgi:hypothetical protein